MSQNDGQRPLLIDVVEVFQIAAGSLRRADRVAAFVDQRVDLQPVAFAGRGHELPQSGGPGVRNGRGREGRFDDRQCAQFDGQSLLEEFIFDEGEIVLRHPEDAAYDVALRVDIAVDVSAYDVVVGQLDRRCQGAQPVGVYRVGDIAFGIRVDQDVFVEELVECVAALPFAPFGHQRVDLFGREFDVQGGGGFGTLLRSGRRGLVGRFGAFGYGAGCFGCRCRDLGRRCFGAGFLFARRTIGLYGLCGRNSEQKQQNDGFFHDQNLRLILNPKTGRLPPAVGT